MKHDILYAWLQLAVGISNNVTRDILLAFDSIEDIYSCEDFSFLGDDREKYKKRLETKDVSSAFEVIKKSRSCGAKVIGYYDELYPAKLKTLKNPPAALYVIGELRDINNIPCTAIVGTRNPSERGASLTESFSYVFASSGSAIISGLAKGIDLCAHRGCVAAEGYTVAVLGCPINDIYPPENEKAFRYLYEHGAVISEMYPGCKRTRADFPNRNRIISALADAVVVAEAGENSGALITARYAVEQGKPLFAIPGPVSKENAGNNGLIKSGAAVLTEPYDVISVLLNCHPNNIKPYEPTLINRLLSYGISAERSQPSQDISCPEKPEKPLKPAETAPKAESRKKPKKQIDIPDTVSEEGRDILLLLASENCLTADEISAKLGKSVSDIMSELTMLELEDLVTVMIGGRYSVNFN